MPVIGIPETGSGVAGASTAEAQKQAAAKVTKVYGFPVPERMKSVTLRSGQVPTAFWTMVDPDGAAIDLSDAVSGDPPDVPVLLRIIEDVAGQVAIEYPGTVVDVEGGAVSAEVDLTKFTAPGIYQAEWAVRDADGVPFFTNRCLVVVDRSLFGTCPYGPPSLAEIRLHLRDSSPAEHRLIDTVTWDDAEIAACISRPIDYFNEALPPLGVYYDTSSFPHRYHWLEGIKANLFFIAAEYYRANSLTYQAGGIAVDDLNKSKDYEAKAAEIWGDYKAWVQQIKISMNIAAGYATESSQYSLYANGYWPGG